MDKGFEMKNKELISIYIPTYNRCELLKRAVFSVLNQCYSNIEIIVVDDGSTDGTIKFLEQISKINHKVKFLVNDKNSGACCSRNRAIKLAKGYFVTGLDDDDYFLPGRLTSFYEAWKAKSDNVILLFDNNLIKTSKGFSHNNYPYTVVKDDLLVKNCIGNQVFTTKATFIRTNLFDVDMPAWQDLDCWFRMLSFGDALNIDVCSLVIDMSHPHERITQGKVSKIFEACDLFSNKLSRLSDKTKVQSQMISYNISIRFYLKFLLLSIFSLDVKFFTFLLCYRLPILLRKRVKKLLNKV
ncbi:Glycosyltransferase [Vibrio chagasii]|nr:Glycosyltransferase [Vibrio chagasii]CAH6867849.1 Glycosyltransferase [Vibrio chagasii]CAH7051928.1 Glycosyltransferase [Vibrio chagasii]CAH7112961.1 Glycosyltransferase [Vibrio chagasii]CAH7303318.1 Glycosyltransferase [Vibrio chagasii]